MVSGEKSAAVSKGDGSSEPNWYNEFLLATSTAASEDTTGGNRKDVTVSEGTHYWMHQAN